MVISVKNISNLVDISPYKKQDEDIISSKNFIRNFGMPEDHIEQHIYTADGTIIYSNYDYRDYKINGDSSTNFSSLVNEFEIEPGIDLENKGFSVGTYRVQYNILRKKISQIDNPFYIKEISQDRKEIRVCSNILSDLDIENSVNDFILEIQNSAFYKDFLLNFGENNFVTAINIALDKNTKPLSFIIKLYEPLPEQYFLNQIFSISEELSNSYAYEVELSPILLENIPPQLKGANFDVEYDDVSVKPSEYFNIDQLLKKDSISSYQQILNKISNKNININIDYSDYSNFIHFSSAKERLLNFLYKLKIIENYNSDLDILKSVPNYNDGLSTRSSVIDIQNRIDDIISKFDDYDNFLYHDSSSASWPKLNSSKPYILYKTTDEISLKWLGSDDPSNNYYGGQLSIASTYDSNNINNLINSVPEFIGIDENNDQYLLFINMIGQHYDKIWIYIDAINRIYKNTNSFHTGISKDLVYTMLNSLGIKLYNSKSNDNLSDYLLGTNESGSYYPITSSFENLITSSITIPGQDQQKELFKRVYHNLPLLLKSKGTTRGLKNLISIFGIPDTILDVTEYGGSDKSNDTYEYSYNRFSYSLNVESGSIVRIPWVPLTQNLLKYNKFNIVPDTIEFRFKPSDLNALTSSLMILDNGDGSESSMKVNIYKSSDEYTYDTLELKILSGSDGYYSTTIDVPIYKFKKNGEYSWWSMMLKRRNIVNYENINNPQYYDIFIKNEIDGNIGHQYSSSIYISGSDNLKWGEYNNVYVSRSIWLGGLPEQLDNTFKGNFQEFRYWSTPLNENAFNAHVLNPISIEGNSISSSYVDLAARFTLGNNLFTYNHFYTHSISSTHIDVTYYSSGSTENISSNGYGFGIYGTALYGVSGSSSGSYSSSINDAYFINFPDKINYDSNIEKYYVNSTSTVYSNPTTDKIRIPDSQILGDVLLIDKSIEDVSEQYTKDIHFTDISFSPQNEINKDVISQYGGTINIDDYIGDPGELGSDIYNDLSLLNISYRNKFLDKFNYKDFIRIIKYFDNSLFKMISDFIPSRTNLSTGLTIKSPILERNKIPVKKPLFENNYNLNTGSTEIVNISYEPNLGIDDKEGIYGELPGSNLDANDYFTLGNNNPYALFKSDFDIKRFNNDNYNCQLGVSSNSLVSSKFKRINQFDNSILEDVELQDYNYELQRSVRPRYDGSKMVASQYNIYTDGDISYGKEPVIKNNVGKLAWIKNIPVKSLNFNDKTSLSIKYMIDSDSNIIELNSNNKNLFEVQNTFKSGDSTILSISDLNQKRSDGDKLIWKGGFSFNPVLYRENGETMNFIYDDYISSQSLSLGFVASDNNEYKYYGGSGWKPSSPITNGAGATWENHFSINNIEVSQTSLGSNMLVSKTINASAWPYNAIPKLSYNNITAPSRPGGGPAYRFSLFNLNNFSTSQFTGITLSNPTGYTAGILNEPNLSSLTNDTYKVTRSGTYKINGSTEFYVNVHDDHGGWSVFKVGLILEKTDFTGYQNDSWQFLAQAYPTSIGYSGNASDMDVNNGSIICDNDGWRKWRLRFDSNVNYVLNDGDYVRFSFYFIDIENIYDYRRTYDAITVGFSNTFWSVMDTNNTNINYVYSSSYNSVSNFFTYETTYNTNDTLRFNDSASAYFYNATFVGDSVNYTPIVDKVSVQKYDLIKFGKFEDPGKYYEVIELHTTGSGASTNYKAVLNEGVNLGINTASNNFAILRSKPDETSIILEGKKMAGVENIDKAMLIPCDSSLVLKSKIGDIIKSLNTTI